MRHFKQSVKRRATGARASIDMFEATLFGESKSQRRSVGRRFNPSTDRKTLQLCRQVQRALSLAFSGQSDDLLRDLQIDGIEPMGSAGHLMVRVIVPAHLSVADVMVRLEARTVMLRAEVAAAICRKRVPALSFVPIAERIGGAP